MYQLSTDSSSEEEVGRPPRLNWQTVERTVSVDFSGVLTLVSFGRYGSHRISQGRAVLLQHRDQDGWRPELTITLESRDLVEDELLDGVWRWNAPEDNYDEERNSYWGRIDELPTEIRRTLLDFLRESDRFEDSAPGSELAEALTASPRSSELSIGEVGGIPTTLLQSGLGSAGGDAYCVRLEPGSQEYRVLQHMVDMGSEYLVPDPKAGNFTDGKRTASKVVDRLLALGYLESTGFVWKNYEIYKALGPLAELTGVGYAEGDRSILGGRGSQEEEWVEEIG